MNSGGKRKTMIKEKKNRKKEQLVDFWKGRKTERKKEKEKKKREGCSTHCAEFNTRQRTRQSPLYAATCRPGIWMTGILFFFFFFSKLEKQEKKKKSWSIFCFEGLGIFLIELINQSKETGAHFWVPYFNATMFSARAHWPWMVKCWKIRRCRSFEHVISK